MNTSSIKVDIKDKNLCEIDLDKNYELNVNDYSPSTIYLLLNTVSENNLTINILPNVNVKLLLFAYGKSSYNLSINLGEDAYLNLYTSDYFKGDTKINKTINLNGKNSSYDLYEYISSSNNKITGSFKVNHLNIDTKASGKFVYLSKNDGCISRDVTSEIEKGMTGSISSENIKGVILDEKSRIDVKPILIISHDDVKASHGCAIGTIDANEIYYLMSRGLSKEDALKIICKSLIAPILREIKEERFEDVVKPILESSVGE